MEAKKEIKVDKRDRCALKNALDGVVRKIFTDDLEYTEKAYVEHVDINVRLVLITLINLVALYACVYDFLYPFPLSKRVLAICVVTYVTLMPIHLLCDFWAFTKEHTVLVCRQKEVSGPDSEWY